MFDIASEVLDMEGIQVTVSICSKGLVFADDAILGALFPEGEKRALRIAAARAPARRSSTSVRRKYRRHALREDREVTEPMQLTRLPAVQQVGRGRGRGRDARGDDLQLHHRLPSQASAGMQSARCSSPGPGLVNVFHQPWPWPVNHA